MKFHVLKVLVYLQYSQIHIAFNFIYLSRKKKSRGFSLFSTSPSTLEVFSQPLWPRSFAMTSSALGMTATRLPSVYLLFLWQFPSVSFKPFKILTPAPLTLKGQVLEMLPWGRWNTPQILLGEHQNNDSILEWWLPRLKFIFNVLYINIFNFV